MTKKELEVFVKASNSVIHKNRVILSIGAICSIPVDRVEKMSAEEFADLSESLLKESLQSRLELMRTMYQLKLSNETGQ